MPELPDVEIFKRYVEATVLHRRIVKTSVKDRGILKNLSTAELKRTLEGRKFRSSRRYGKFLFVAVDGAGWLVLHFGMTGFLKYFEDTADAPPHTRVLIEFENGCYLAYDSMRKLGKLSLAGSIKGFIQKRKLGLDAFDPKLDMARFRAVLAATRSPVKSALMNQRLIAGIGNVYSDEVLFHAGLHPKSRSDRLPQRSVSKLFRATRTTLKNAVRYRADPNRFPKSCLLPHRKRAGQCPRCRRALRRLQVSGRTAYFCPNHQKKN